MKVYVVCYNDCDGQETKGVFTKERKAVQFANSSLDSNEKTYYMIEVWEDTKLLDESDIVEKYTKKFNNRNKECHFDIMMADETNEMNYGVFFDANNLKGFILWNKTQNSIYEISDEPNGFSMNEFSAELEPDDKMYIVDVSTNEISPFVQYY